MDEAVNIHAHRYEQHVVAYAYGIATLSRPDPIVVLNRFDERKMSQGLGRAEELARFVFKADRS